MSVDRGVIDEQLRAIREGEHWWEQREFRQLANVLYPGERLHGLINGKLLGRLPRPHVFRKWLFVATDQRIICMKHGSFARKQIDISPGMITRVYHSSRLHAYQVTIVTTVQKYRLRVPKADAFRFVQALLEVIPSQSVHRLSPGLEALSWVPGITTVAALPGVERMLTRATTVVPDHVPRAELQRLEDMVDRLQNDVDRLVEQVTFLENLLQKRAEQNYLTESTADS